MSYLCIPCNRTFNTNKALQQHEQNAPAHDFGCATCNRRFRSEQALSQHESTSAAHATSVEPPDHHLRPPTTYIRDFVCTSCVQTFRSQEALDKHVRYSPAHVFSFNCESCNQSFGSQQALQHHQLYSLAHALYFDNGYSSQSHDISSEDTPKHLRRYSPAHASPSRCERCNRSFSSREALTQHLQDSPIHRQDSDSPLDVFFSSFPGFIYDPALPPATSYRNVQRQQGWRPGDAASGDAWDRYQDALNNELRLWYGSENDLGAWHALCRAIGIESPPQTCNQCETVVRGTYVNIIDLIEWGRGRGRTERRVQTFRDLEELRRYTKETKKIFHGPLDEEDNNVVLRHLLRKIFAL